MEIRLSQPYSFCRVGNRTNQEDARFPDEDIPRGGDAAFLVCDGVGGIDCGEVASRIVADCIGNSLSKYNLSRPFDVSVFERLLKEAVERLTAEFRCLKKDMATTLTFLCFHSEGAFIAHIGDSRIYHIRPGVGILHQTSDHSLVNALVHSGNITPEEAIEYPHRNVITRCVHPEGSGEHSVATTLQIRDVECGDYFILCSDGVTQCIEDGKFYDIVSSSEEDDIKIREIENLCRDSSDNNTAFLIRIADVVYNDKDKDLARGFFSVVESSDSDTKPLTSLNDEIIETRDAKEKSLRSRISDFFIRIFN